MNTVVSELRDIVAAFSAALLALPEPAFSFKPHAGKWSKKEIIGHLIDSGHNNLRRFICGQYEEAPHIRYEQDFWVAANNYQAARQEDVVALWAMVNERIAVVLAGMPAVHYSRVCNTGGSVAELHTLEWLAQDYVRHLKHHLNQVFPASFGV